jgi:hypothetical protein
MPNSVDGEMPEAIDSIDFKAELERTRAALAKANKEAASYRIKAQKAEEEKQKRKEAEMTELERLQQQLSDIQAERDNLRLDMLRKRVAAAVGLPDILAGRLQGETEEELKADAEALLETLPKPAPKLPTIAATNPGNNAQAPGETLAQQRQRVYGTQVDVFNPVWSEQHGGGVRFPDK